MPFAITKRNALQGLLIYAAGDSVAAMILGVFSPWRLMGIMLIGATVYAWEIPAYFRWIDRRTSATGNGPRRALARTGLALLYFNPLWIARHLLFIVLFSANGEALRLALLQTAFLSWLVNIPIAIIGNFVIQVVLPLRWRFAGSAIFSGLMAIYYALSGVWFDA